MVIVVGTVESVDYLLSIWDTAIQYSNLMLFDLIF